MSAPDPAGGPTHDSVHLRAPSERVSPKARLMWGLEDLLRGAVLLVVLALASGPWNWFELPWWLFAAVLVLVVGYVVLVPLWRFHVHRWEVTESAVYTQTGWWARERRIAPMSRVQTVDHREGAIARLFGLATVRITTASSAGALTIEGLAQHRALALVEDLTRMADTVPGDAT